jgi:hypothetical protein
MVCRQTLGRYPDFFGKSEKSGLEPYGDASQKSGLSWESFL